jgi:uncharacterized protein
MLKRLPVFVEPLRYADEGKSLQGEMSIAEMDRLQALLSRNQAWVKININFAVDELKNKFIQGQVQADLSLTCQRCLQSMTVSVTSDFLLGLVVNQKQADELSQEYEPMIVTAKSVKLAAIIEDELLLALPIAPAHSDPQCSTFGIEHTLVNEQELAGANPFSVLKYFNKAKS